MKMFTINFMKRKHQLNVMEQFTPRFFLLQIFFIPSGKCGCLLKIENSLKLKYLLTFYADISCDIERNRNNNLFNMRFNSN